ncbi:MAG: hypothetical protein V4447_10565 [Pseudomonadota bacterium]
MSLIKVGTTQVIAAESGISYTSTTDSFGGVLVTTNLSTGVSNPTPDTSHAQFAAIFAQAV